MIAVSKLSKRATAYSDKLRGMPYLVEVAIFYILMFVPIVLYVPIGILVEYINGPSPDVQLKPDMFSALIAAPIIETLVGQWLVFKILEKLSFFKNKPLFIVSISALLFGAGHCYSFMYVVFACLVGIVLGYVFNFYRPNYSYAFWTTCFLHFLKNFTAVLLSGQI